MGALEWPGQATAWLRWSILTLSLLSLVTSGGSAFPKGAGRRWGTTPYPTHPCQPFQTVATLLSQALLASL